MKTPTRKMKGITPIISIIILLLITVALAGSAWFYLSNMLTTNMGKSFMLTPGGTFCDANNKIHVRVSNTGTSQINAADWGTNGVEISGGGTTTTIAGAAVPQKSTYEFVSSTALPSGTYTITIGTISSIFTTSVTC